jgi:hypothetical protein
MPVTFPVDDVAPTPRRLETRPLSDRFGDVLAIGGEPDLPTIDDHGLHPLLAAVHQAFADHRPLVLSPDAIWLTIAEGVAQHVRLHADELRSALVRHAGRTVIEIEHAGGAPATAEGWARIVRAFRGAVAPRVEAGLASLLVCDFSTTTDLERVASEIVLLDAVSPYFDYRVLCVCGIPSVTLAGTPDDWKDIRSRLFVLDELGLRFWTASLTRIADELVAASEGHPDRQFWQSICKPRQAYGPEQVTGWIARLYPYVEHRGRVVARNPLLDVRIGRESDEGGFVGIDPASVPARRSSARIRVQDLVADERFEVELEGGLVAVAQEPDGALRPVAGYAVRRAEASIFDVVDRMVAEHDVAPPTDEDRKDTWGTAELVAFSDRVGTAVLFAGTRPWRIRRPLDRDTIEFAGAERLRGTRLLDLPDGRCVVLISGRQDALYAICDRALIAAPDKSSVVRAVRSSEDGAALRIVGRSLAAILTRALDTAGDPGLPLGERLADALDRKAG